MIIVRAPMVIRIKIIKFKIHQYLLRANSPNSMLAKSSRYTVGSYTIHNKLTKTQCQLLMMN